ncbi:hypothetical protein [Chryseobacterium sp.]|uniref:hypothetical protein n=1 Tax=Chryseobacterium sp. TaxID=1871047 RepID=UPI0035B3CEE5
MFIDGDFRAIYLNCKIKEIVPFLKSLPKDKKETIALFKKYVNKERNQNVISLSASQAGSKNENGYFFIGRFLFENFCFFEQFIQFLSG